MSSVADSDSPRENLRFYIDTLLARSTPWHDHAERMAYAAFAFEVAAFAVVMFAATAQRFAPPLAVLAAGAATIVLCHVALASQLRRARAAAFLRAFAFALIREVILPEGAREAAKPKAPLRPARGLPLVGPVAGFLFANFSQAEAEADPRIPESLKPLAPLARVQASLQDVAVPLASLAMVALLAARIAFAWPTGPGAQPTLAARPAARPAAHALALNVQAPTPAPPLVAAASAPPAQRTAGHASRAVRRVAPAPGIEPPSDPRPYWSGGGTWRSYASDAAPWDYE